MGAAELTVFGRVWGKIPAEVRREGGREGRLCCVCFWSVLGESGSGKLNCLGARLGEWGGWRGVWAGEGEFWGKVPEQWVREGGGVCVFLECSRGDQVLESGIVWACGRRNGLVGGGLGGRGDVLGGKLRVVLDFRGLGGLRG